MVEIDHKIIITGIICLTFIYTIMCLSKQNTETLAITIIGVIALAIGVIIPSPKIDNKRGVLIW